MGEVIQLQEYIERRNGIDRGAIQRRIADLGLQIVLMASEKSRLEIQLKEGDNS